MLRGEVPSIFHLLVSFRSVPFPFSIFHPRCFVECRTGMAGVPGTASAIFESVKDVGANVIMISQVYRTLFLALKFGANSCS